MSKKPEQVIAIVDADKSVIGSISRELAAALDQFIHKAYNAGKMAGYHAGYDQGYQERPLAGFDCIW